MRLLKVQNAFPKNLECMNRFSICYLWQVWSILQRPLSYLDYVLLRKGKKSNKQIMACSHMGARLFLIDKRMDAQKRLEIILSGKRISSTQ